MRGIFLFVVMLMGMSAVAQYGGVDRSIGGPGQFQTKNKDKKSEFDFVQASTDKMAKELSLDDFQKAATKNIIQEYKEKVLSISAEEIPDTGKSEKMNLEKDKMEAKLKELLNKDQLAKFQALKDKMDKKKNSKKKTENSQEEDKN
ncbi:hypothetical protein [Flavobacterium sp.]|uniref:hypothetical protein n=1 Tax=Flavobacterium sp. TaxID=239 RepID=UPI00261DBE0A|nr:hypothetical protein [Flavobacterium sp.]